ncbi:MAG: HIT family protein [Alphaproteobacteria bacterium]|jgi:histidine triad (HIT) family protein|nr:HIT family protein [Alphaproteobacteria bacterium]MDP6815336.1 HIT family protein [Alphaproteobacteria bacterium]
MTDCIFCKIVAGEVPAHVIVDEDEVIAIMDVGHVNPGHTLVIAKAHAETIMDLSEDVAARMFRVANRVAKALERTYEPDGMTILQANRPAGFQTVGHVHLHVLPRHHDDGVTLTWPGKNPPQDQLAATAEQLRAVL